MIYITFLLFFSNLIVWRGNSQTHISGVPFTISLEKKEDKLCHSGYLQLLILQHHSDSFFSTGMEVLEELPLH